VIHRLDVLCEQTHEGLHCGVNGWSRPDSKPSSSPRRRIAQEHRCQRTARKIAYCVSSIIACARNDRITRSVVGVAGAERRSTPMRKVPKAVYQTADEIDARIKNRQADAERLPQGEQRQSILKEVAQLRVYAEAKRWTESPELKPAR